MGEDTLKSKLVPSDYVHLHNHTHFSVLDGLTKIPQLIDRVKELGMEAVAKTDHGTLSGTIEFYKTATSGDVHPIIGMETYIAARLLTDKEPGKDKPNFHLILLAMNNEGYQNLMKLSTIGNLEGMYYKPRLDHPTLEKYSAGLICLSACMGGELGENLKNGQYDAAKEIAAWYKKVFGDRYYLEVQDSGHLDHPSFSSEQKTVNDGLFRLAEELDLPVVLTCDAHYLRHEDQAAHEVLLCVQTGSFLSDEKRMSLTDFELHVTDPKDIIKRWGKDHPEVITNSKKIANRCNVSIEFGKILIPKFPVPAGETDKTYLQKLVWRGLAWRYGKTKTGSISRVASTKLTIEQAKKTLDDAILERANYELSVIDNMGYDGYFLIVQDFINWGKDRDIVFGPGRGSAAGSIISYALRITELDPLKYDLLFERFLNPDRISMPDVDIDIQDTRRDEVIQYCVQKYGKERVANIGTFGKMAARNAVRDVSRVMQIPYAQADHWSKMIPPPVQGHHIPLAESLKNDKDLKAEYNASPEAKKVFDLAVQLDGTIRSHGIHAAGVVIAPDDVVKFAPLEMAQKGVVATQYPFGFIEELGLLKMDFLGLGNLTIIKNALRIIKKVHGKNIDISQIPLDDPKTFKLFQEAETVGVFQFESAGMQRYLQQLKPSVFEDIIAMVALYRPGPMQFIDDFISRKHGKSEITYFHSSMEPALKNTYGVLVYQEQVMQISKDVCGFTGGEADTLRKAIGKKKIDIMRKMKQRMIEGGQAVSGISQEQMEKFWKQLEDFAAYCFNKAHAACYGLIAYQTAYLKAHYPAAYMAALMTSAYGDTGRLAIEIAECKKMGIDVLVPSVNESFDDFSVVPHKKQIRFGLDSIKNVGAAAARNIIDTRDAGGPFKSLADFLSRVDSRVVNKRVLESLIKTGAFNEFGTRQVLLFNLDSLLAFSARQGKERLSGQTGLFGGSDDTLVTQSIELNMAAPEISPTVQLGWERELLGLFLSSHPLDAFEILLGEQATSIGSLSQNMDGKLVTIGGYVVEVRQITTKKGSKMAFVKLADLSGELELILFARTLESTAELWQPDKVLLISGTVTARDLQGNASEVKLKVESAREIGLPEARSYKATGHKKDLLRAGSSTSRPVEPRLYVRLKDASDQALLASLKEVFDASPGATDIVLVLGADSSKQIIKLPTGIAPTDDVSARLKTLVGEANIKLQ